VTTRRLNLDLDPRYFMVLERVRQVTVARNMEQIDLTPPRYEPASYKHLIQRAIMLLAAETITEDDLKPV